MFLRRFPTRRTGSTLTHRVSSVCHVLILLLSGMSIAAVDQSGSGNLVGKHRPLPERSLTVVPSNGRRDSQQEALAVYRSAGHMANPKIKQTIAMMEAFAARTGLTGDRHPRRYLWTDAFAVCNFLGLTQTTGEQRYLDLALRLIDQVHHTLGRHRDDDPRTGWLSGLNQRDGESHPTRGGLRVGKPLPERGPGEPFDPRLEWERDGQYFHYLTKWMHALDQVSRSTGEPQFNTWARELAAAAGDAFIHHPSTVNALQMYWKMSIDLTRSLVSSMGQHDPLDGFVTMSQLRATAEELPRPGIGPELEPIVSQFASMLEVAEFASPDPLGIGGLLVDAYRIEQLMRRGIMLDEALLERLLMAALAGLRVYARSGELQAPAGYRLAFREFGLAIGLHAIERMHQNVLQGPMVLNPTARAQLKAVMSHVPLADQIEAFWGHPKHQEASTWLEHRDINEVMLATSLLPDGFLVLMPPD